MHRVFNFSSGPSMLPNPILHKIERELYNWNNIGVSVMEISHRSKEFFELVESSEENLRELMMIPDSYKVLFCHGGARAQFSAVPMNLLGNNHNADYINTGYWSNSAKKEAEKYCNSRSINVIVEIDGCKAVQPMNKWNLSEDNAYVHYCPNETADGIAIYESPNFKNQTIVADFSSSILSYPIDVSKFGMIYACAQKNIGPSGITLVIINNDLLNRQKKSELPSILDYNILSKHHSMFNTPPTFAWYVSNLVFQWLKSQGGLSEIRKINTIKSSILYHAIDNSDFYWNNISPSNRSMMNIPFRLIDEKLNELFLQESRTAGLLSLQGHRSTGGMRASLYNAMPLEGVNALVDFMMEFVRRHG